MTSASPDVVAHHWHADRCTQCGIGRHETWVLDDEERSVMALVWTQSDGLPFRAVQFAWMRGTAPSTPPLATLAEAFPGVPTGAEPACGTPQPQGLASSV